MNLIQSGAEFQLSEMLDLHGYMYFDSHLIPRLRSGTSSINSTSAFWDQLWHSPTKTLICQLLITLHLKWMRQLIYPSNHEWRHGRVRNWHGYTKNVFIHFIHPEWNTSYHEHICYCKISLREKKINIKLIMTYSLRGLVCDKSPRKSQYSTARDMTSWNYSIPNYLLKVTQYLIHSNLLFGNMEVAINN